MRLKEKNIVEVDVVAWCDVPFLNTSTRFLDNFFLFRVWIPSAILRMCICVCVCVRVSVSFFLCVWM